MRSRHPATPLVGSRPLPADSVMYIAAWPVVASAVICAGQSIESVPGLLNFLLAVVSVGIATSYWLRRIRADRRQVNLVVTGAAAVLGVAAVVVDQDAVLETVSVHWLLQSGIDGLIVTFLIRGIAWIAAFRCFTMLTDLELVLSIGFSLSLFILVAVVQSDTALLWFLIPFSIGSLDLLLRYHARTLQQSADKVVGRRVRPWRQEVGSVGGLALGVAIGTAAMSFVAGNVEIPSFLDQGGWSLTDTVSTWFERLQGLGQDADQLKQMDIGGQTGSNSMDEVFRVRTPDCQLWRGNVYARYDGRTWYPAADEQLEIKRIGPGLFLTGGTPADLERPDLVEHRVTYTVPGPLLYNARNLVGLEVRPFRVSFSRSGRGKTWPAMPRGTVCRLYCLPDQATDAASRPLNVLTPAERETYLQLPDDLPSRVRDRAQQAIGNADDPAGRMDLLSAYLSESKYYTEKPDRIPQDADAVDWFLTEMESGWCRHFASSVAVLGRCVGVPTRLVDGFLPGSISGDRNQFVVRQRDAHVWCEAWLPERGWVSYDPTATTDLEPARLPQSVLAFQQAIDRLTRGLRTRLPGGPGQVLLLLAAVTGLMVWQGRRRGWTFTILPGWWRTGQATGLLRIERRLRRLLRRLQLSREPHEPELLFASRAARRLPAAELELRVVSELICAGRYSGQPLDDGQLDQADDALARIAQAVADQGGWFVARSNRVGGGPDDGLAAEQPADASTGLAPDARDARGSAAAAAPDGPAGS